MLLNPTADDAITTATANAEKKSRLTLIGMKSQISVSRIVAAMVTVPEKFRAQATWTGNIVHKIWGPASTGWLKLASADVDDTPKVMFNYFHEPEDLATCERGIRATLNTIHAKALASLQYTNESVPDELRPVKDAIESAWPPRDFGNKTQDSMNIRQWCIDSVQTLWHYHGGCLVDKVVDQNYRVKGVESLRVIDGSTFKRSPGTNPQGTLMLLGRYTPS